MPLQASGLLTFGEVKFSGAGPESRHLLTFPDLRSRIATRRPEGVQEGGPKCAKNIFFPDHATFDESAERDLFERLFSRFGPLVSIVVLSCSLHAACEK